MSDSTFSALASVRGFVLAATGLAAACGGATTPTADGPIRVFDVPEGASVKLVADRVVPDPLVMYDVNGTPWSMEELQGKVVLLNFWATWCGPCRLEIPDLIKIQDRYRDQVQIIGVSLDEGGPGIVTAFANELKMNYPVVMATPQILEQFPGVFALPTTFVLDPDGAIAQTHIGLVSPGVMEQEARVLASLSADVTVELVEPTVPRQLVDAAQATEIPGLDLSMLTPAQKEQALQRLNKDGCSCGCGLTLAGCRINDPACDVSLPLAQTVVEEIASS